jgi:hypothetical protein
LINHKIGERKQGIEGGNGIPDGGEGLAGGWESLEKSSSS